MKKKISILFDKIHMIVLLSRLKTISIVLVLVLGLAAKVAMAQGFETAIHAFEQSDLVSPPPANPMLFVGSSSIRVWPDLVGDFPDYPVMNRGFGGSKMSDVLYYFDRIVAPYDPAMILVYEGDNDLAAGMSVGRVYADYVEFLALVKEQLPEADVAFIATKPSPSRSQYLEVTRQLNARLEDLASNNSHLWFIDVFTPMLNESGQPRPELFFSDMLHMNAAGYELWQSIIEPFLAAWAMLIDLNGDGIVDCADICMIVEHWHTDEPFYDIAPPPFGDGIVDVQDLILLSEHLFTYPGAVAYWKLDETEGMVVADSAGDNNGYALGDPIWMPTDGIVDGALQLDGVDDFISAPAPLNPADGPFSAFVWIKGGAAGQAIISTPGGPDWLSLDPLAGHLMTELTSGGRDASSLLAETTIADGNWHRIGLVWDGSNRTLYVDGVVVAEDTQNGLQSSTSSFYIGTGNAMAPGTYFSGLIDDVRIYNRAVTPSINYPLVD